MSFSPKNGDSWLQRLPCVKYYNVLKRVIDSGLNTAKNTDYMKKKTLSQSCELNFLHKIKLGAHVYLPQEWR